jgi:hypothetical protein
VGAAEADATKSDKPPNVVRVTVFNKTMPTANFKHLFFNTFALITLIFKVLLLKLLNVGF